MVVVRAQDFASRTLRRVSGELGAMSKAEAIQFRRSQLMLRQMQQADRIRRTMEQGRALRLVKERQIAEAQLQKMQRLPVVFGAGGAARLEHLRNTLARVDKQLLEVSPNVRRFSDQLRRLSEAGVPLNRRLEMLDAALAGNTRRLRQLGIAAGMTRTEIQAFDRAIRAIPIQNLDNIAHAMSGIGRTMQLFGAIGTVSFGLAARSAAEFSKEVSLAATQARDLTVDARPISAVMADLENGVTKAGRQIDGILGLMTRYPASAEDMTAATYEIFSSMQLEENGVFNVAKGLGLLEKANQIAVAGMVDLSEATNAMITVLNNFDPRAQNVNKVLDDMFDIVRFGRMRLSDFNIMMNKLAPAAADAGQSLEDVGGAMAVLTTLMPSQRMVATGLARALEALQHPDVVKGLHMMGVEVRDSTGHMRSFYDIIRDIADEFPALTEGGLTVSEFFRTITARARGGGRGIIFTQEGRRVLSELIHNMDLFIERQNQITTNQNEFNRAFRAQLRTPGVQWAIFTNQLRALVLVIGKEAIPVFAEIGTHIQSFIRWFRELDPATRGAIVRIATFASVATLVGGAFLAIFGSLLAFEAMLRRLALGSGAAASMLGSLWIIVRRLAAIGAITLIVNAVRGGDPGVWNLLIAAATGAALGSRFGVPGAVIGAITLPVIIKIIGGRQKTPVEQAFEDFKADLNKNRGFFDRAIREFFSPVHGGPQLIGPNLAEFEDFDEFKAEWERTVRFVKGHKLDPSSVDAFGRATLEAARAQFPLMDAVLKTMRTAKKETTLLDEIAKAAKRTQEAIRKGNLQAAREQADQLRALYDQMIGGTEEVNRRQEQISQIAKEAHQQAVDSLRNMYMQMEQENRRFFGELFQGPWLTSETFDLAKEWGITPRIQDMIRDLREQNVQFERWRSSLDRVLKRGLPADFVNELRQMGPEEGQALLDQIIGATPRQVNNLIAQWRRREEQIKSQTKMDFRDEIERFKQAGVNMGDAIINGFQQAEVGLWFDNWIQRTFPAIIDAAVAKAVADWKQTNPATAVPTLPPSARPQRGRAPGTGGNTSNTTTMDNSKTAHVTIDMRGEQARSASQEAEARKAAFTAVNIVRSVWF